MRSKPVFAARMLRVQPALGLYNPSLSAYPGHRKAVILSIDLVSPTASHRPTIYITLIHIACEENERGSHGMKDSEDRIDAGFSDTGHVIVQRFVSNRCTVAFSVGVSHNYICRSVAPIVVVGVVANLKLRGEKNPRREGRCDEGHLDHRISGLRLHWIPPDNTLYPDNI